MSDAQVIERVWLTVDEAKVVTGVSRTDLYAALQAGELRGSQRVRRGKWRIHRSDLNDWLRGQAAA